MAIKYIKTIFTISTLLLITGCGGGGNSGNRGNYSGGSGGGNSGNSGNYSGGSGGGNSGNSSNRNCNFTLDNNISSPAYALGYLNKLRCLSGEHNFTMNNKLTNAAQAHSNYLDYTHLTGHYENNNSHSRDYYTGNKPNDRAKYQGYKSSILENVSNGQNNYKKSIDDLFGAIYHRFGFLSLEVDEIGIGKKSNNYTYDMGNSNWNNNCNNNSSQYGWNVCLDGSKISNSDYQNGRNYYKQNTPKEIIWPPANAKNIPPAFFNETPDPLPNYDVSGYPISVIFNDTKVEGNVTINTNGFSLKDENYTPVNIIKLLNKNSDDNNETNEYEFAIFPEKRLDWGSEYHVYLTYSDNNGTHNKQWCFSTRSLASFGANKVYKITNTNSNISLQVESNKTYAIYIVPKDANETFNQWSVPNNYEFSTIDSNTILIKAVSDGNITLSNTNNSSYHRTLHISIGSDNNATQPKNQTCPQ